MSRSEHCPICGSVPHPSEKLVLVDGRARRAYCSPACLRIGVRAAAIARRKARLRGLAVVLAFALVGAGAVYVRRLALRLRKPHAPVVASAPPAPPPLPPEEPPFGPHWPPTDDDWLEEFAHASWVYPLPGPTRRAPTATRELYATAEKDPALRARCRTAGRCAVELGGQLWGEHVYAAHDGVIDRLQRDEDAAGGISVRIAHWGGVVFTHYDHLAAVPTRVTVGTRVLAGDVIGLVGDTGTADARARLGFSLSVRPSSALPEIYWDPTPLMSGWPLHTPERGSVAGLTSIDAPPERIVGTPTMHAIASRHRAAQ